MSYLAGFSEFLEDEAMATAADYRKWAEECFQWAREAADESVREQYASLGRVWLECAARAELQSGVMAAPEPKPGRRWPSRGKRRAAINVARRRVARLARQVFHNPARQQELSP